MRLDTTTLFRFETGTTARTGPDFDVAHSELTGLYCLLHDARHRTPGPFSVRDAEMIGHSLRNIVEYCGQDAGVLASCRSTWESVTGRSRPKAVTIDELKLTLVGVSMAINDVQRRQKGTPGAA